MTGLELQAELEKRIRTRIEMLATANSLQIGGELIDMIADQICRIDIPFFMDIGSMAPREIWALSPRCSGKFKPYSRYVFSDGSPDECESIIAFISKEKALIAAEYQEKTWGRVSTPVRIK